MGYYQAARPHCIPKAKAIASPFEIVFVSENDKNKKHSSHTNTHACARAELGRDPCTGAPRACPVFLRGPPDRSRHRAARPTGNRPGHAPSRSRPCPSPVTGAASSQSRKYRVSFQGYPVPLGRAPLQRVGCSPRGDAN